MKLTLGFSPCPNDTFIFDALVNKKFDTDGIEYEFFLEDVETLNQWAFEEKLDISKLSFPAFFRKRDAYSLLNSGGALGKGVGPLLISAKNKIFGTNEINNSSIALPGINTTANLLFSFAYPGAKNKLYKVFNEIEDCVVSGACDLGVIIHENRFTYQQKGLFKVVDLGSFWEEKMNAPIPLGCIAAKSKLGKEIIDTVDRHIHHSLSVAFNHYPEINPFVRQHAQAMSEEVMRKHIDLYVNHFTLDPGAEGKAAIKTLESVYSGLS